MDETDHVSETVEANADDGETDRSTGTNRGSPGKNRRSTDGCACCGGDGDADFEHYARKVRLEAESSLIEAGDESTVLDADLPEDVRSAAERFFGGGAVDTLGDWVSEVRGRAGGGSIDVEDLCHEDERTGHWGELDGERYHFTCFFDAVVLAAMTDERVDVRTESPGGTVVEATATGEGDLTVDPPGTLVSFGVATDPATVPDGDPTPEDMYAAVCPVVQAFPTPRDYDRWADDVPAATVAMPLEDATDLAAALAG